MAKKKTTKKKAAKKTGAKKKAAAPKKKAASKKAASKKAAPRKKQAAKKAAPKKNAGPKKQAAAESPNRTVDAYIASLGGWKQMVAQMLRQAARRAAPEAKESIKWGQPVYEDGGPFAYFKAFGNSINFGFWRGAELVDPHKLLTGDGEKMRHIAIRGVQDVKPQYLEELIREAVLLNRAKGDPTTGEE